MTPPTVKLSCGLDFISAADISECLSETGASPFAGEQQSAPGNETFKFISVPVVHPRFRRRYAAGDPLKKQFTRTEILLASHEWNAKIVGKLSPYLDVDSPVDKVQKRYEDTMLEELSYCRGLGLAAVMLDLKSDVTANLARILTNHLSQSSNTCTIWVGVMMDERGWQRWSTLHEQMCWDSRIGVAVTLPADLPDEELVRKWLGEPIKCLITPTSIFQANKKGFPILSKCHALLFARLTRRGIQAMVSGARRYQTTHYLSYLAFAHIRYEAKDYSYDKVTMDAMDNYARGWEDHPQVPLQPLADNLDQVTYSVFEKDPIKYNQYQKAITQILHKFKEEGFSEPKMPKLEDLHVEIGERPLENGCGEEGKGEAIGSKERPIIVMVLGAGRGPLVRAALNAGEVTQTHIKVYAVEKNPGALVTLLAQAKEVWGNQVTVLAGDMRRLPPPEKAHLIISELLGSWGDNELSPECLWGARSLVAKGGYSIPSRYVSYVAPLQSATVWQSIKSQRPQYPPVGITGIHTIQDALQAIWVIYLKNKFDIGESKPAFTFEHPPETGCRDPEFEDGRRRVTLEWTADQNCILHGFSGYFHADLADGIDISIRPSTHSPGMISWFPVFIPIKTPLRVFSGNLIRASFWRCCDQNRVWYEWIASVRTGKSGDALTRSTAIHNSNGHNSYINL